MTGDAIGARALADAGKRALPTEQQGPRSEGVRPEVAHAPVAEAHTLTPTKP